MSSKHGIYAMCVVVLFQNIFGIVNLPEASSVIEKWHPIQKLNDSQISHTIPEKVNVSEIS